MVMIDFLNKFFDITDTPKRSVLLLSLSGIVVGVANAMLVAIVGEALRRGSDLNLMVAVVSFVGCALIFIVLFRYSQARGAQLTANAVARIRLKVVNAVLKASLADNERIDHYTKRLALSRDALQVASALPNIIDLLISAATVCCILAYLAWLSWPMMLAVCAVTILAIVVYQALISRTAQPLRAAYAEDDRAFGFIDDLLLGYKELKLDTHWAQEFVEQDLVPAVKHASVLLGGVRSRQQGIGLVGLVAFLMLLGGAAFIMPLLNKSGIITANTILVLLYLQAFVQNIVLRLPSLAEVGQAAGRIRKLLAELGSHADNNAVPSSVQALPQDWDRLRLEGVSYSYQEADDAEGFRLQDVNLTITRGQIVFIIGGNGSGKTTLAKLLVGLYRPSQGEILIGNTIITDTNRSAYRQLFNAVFTDVHLFRRRVSPQLLDPDSAVQRALTEMSIRLTVTEEQRLDTKPFSQGQKKRLASALALASDKPLCLFDEWTADQDPEFRAYFYNRYLPDLKAVGKTLLVISHDDHYFKHADVIVRMDSGRVIWVGPPSSAADLKTQPELLRPTEN
jgi:putative ATP-binding cassette transporter